MNKAVVILWVLVALAGCAGGPGPSSSSSPCATKGEASIECQAIRYSNGP